MNRGYTLPWRKTWANPLLCELGKKFSRLKAWLYLTNFLAGGINDDASGLKRGESCSTTTTGSLAGSVSRFEWRMQERRSRVDRHSMFGSGAKWASMGYRSHMAHPTRQRTSSG